MEMVGLLFPLIIEILLADNQCAIGCVVVSFLHGFALFYLNTEARRRGVFIF